MSRKKCREVSVKYRTIRRTPKVTVRRDQADGRSQTHGLLTRRSVANPKVP